MRLSSSVLMPPLHLEHAAAIGCQKCRATAIQDIKAAFTTKSAHRVIGQSSASEFATVMDGFQLLDGGFRNKGNRPTFEDQRDDPSPAFRQHTLAVLPSAVTLRLARGRDCIRSPNLTAQAGFPLALPP
jgi:hypothetical protein